MSTINKGFDVKAPQAADRSYGRIVAGVNVPYTSVAQANAAVNIAYRHRGKTVLIDLGAGAVEYWWRDGVDNDDLIIKSSADDAKPFRVITDVEVEYVIAQDRLLDKIVVIPTNNFDLSVGLTQGASDLVPQIPMLANQANVVNLDVPAWGAPQSIWFSGMATTTTFLLYFRSLIPSNP